MRPAGGQSVGPFRFHVYCSTLFLIFASSIFDVAAAAVAKPGCFPGASFLPPLPELCAGTVGALAFGTRGASGLIILLPAMASATSLPVRDSCSTRAFASLSSSFRCDARRFLALSYECERSNLTSSSMSADILELASSPYQTGPTFSLMPHLVTIAFAMRVA